MKNFSISGKCRWMKEFYFQKGNWRYSSTTLNFLSCYKISQAKTIILQHLSGQFHLYFKQYIIIPCRSHTVCSCKDLTPTCTAWPTMRETSYDTLVAYLRRCVFVRYGASDCKNKGHSGNEMEKWKGNPTSEELSSSRCPSLLIFLPLSLSPCLSIGCY